MSSLQNPIEALKERLRKFGSGAVISKKLLWKILSEELVKYGVYSYQGIRGYYVMLRDLGIIQELNRQKIEKEDGSIESMQFVRIMLSESSDFDFHLKNICAYCGKEFNSKAELSEHLYNCDKSPYFVRK